MTLEEHETHVHFDYAIEEVMIYTTRPGVKNGILRRLPEGSVQLDETINGGRPVAWTLRMPMSLVRDPHMITKPPTWAEKALQKL